jgi:hypothetical protein
MDNFPFNILTDHSTPRAESRRTLFPFDGWCLSLVGQIEDAAPGFLNHVLKASPKWRQSLFTALAFNVLDRADDFILKATGMPSEDVDWRGVLRALADALRSMSARDIVTATLGVVPHALSGCLGKIGMQPMRSADSYRKLITLLIGTDADSRSRAKTLVQLNRLDADILDAVLLIDSIALIPEIFTQVRCGVQARRVNGIISAIRVVSDATDEAIRQSLDHRKSGFRCHEFADAWLAKSHRLPPVSDAVEQHPEFLRVTPASAEEVSRTFNNCMRSKMTLLVTGVWSAWVWTPGDVIAALTKFDEGIVLSGIHGRSNGDVPPAVARQLRETLSGLGVLCFTRSEVPEVLRPLTLGRWDNFELDELEFG